MKATLTFDFSDRLNADEQRELLGETITRNVPMEDILVEALRMRRAALGLSPSPRLPVSTSETHLAA